MWSNLYFYWQRYASSQWSKCCGLIRSSWVSPYRLWKYALLWHTLLLLRPITKPHFNLCFTTISRSKKIFFSQRVSWKRHCNWHMYASNVVGFYWQCKISSFFGIRIFKVRFMTQLIEEILNSIVREINVNWNAVLLIVVSLMKYIANRPILIY